MANNLTNFAENKLLGHVTGQASWSAPTATYLALYNTTPQETGGGVEVAGGGYARQAITWGVPASGAISNSVTITFPTATDDNWGTITAIAIIDDPSGGNLLAYGPLSTPRTISDTDVFRIQSGQLTLSLE
jgi:hypothetical protein